MLLFYLLLLFFGLAIGSFLGMLTYRLPRGLSITGRSFCDHCQRKISWRENIPLLAYLVLKKCRCGGRIPARYPLIEATTALFFVITAFSYQLQQSTVGQNLLVLQATDSLGFFSLPFFLLIVTLLLALAVIDIEEQILPDILVYILGSLVFGYLIFFTPMAVFSHLLSGYLAFLFFLAIYLATRGKGMGFGDVKLVFVLGGFLGFPGVLLWIFVAFLCGALVGMILLFSGRARLGVPIPFGPFLLFAFWLAIFYGEQVIVWYTGLL